VSRTAKGPIAVGVLVLLLVAFGVALAVTPTARVRYWAWRMHSSSREVRLEARTRLMAIGRPAIDAVFRELVAGEVADRLASVPGPARVAFLGHARELTPRLMQVDGKGPPRYVVEQSIVMPSDTILAVSGVASPEDPLAMTLARGAPATERKLVVGHTGNARFFVEALLTVPLPESDPLGPELIEATRARLAADR